MSALRFSDPTAPWWRRFYDFFRDKCPECKCWDFVPTGAHQWDGPVLLCLNCGYEWAFDTSDR
jgi:hypothetical protein